MKKPVDSDDLMTALARQMGHTAGVIVKATQGLAANATHTLSGDSPEKPARTARRRAAPKKKKKTVSSSTLSSRKRTASAVAAKKTTRKKKRRTT